MIAPLSWLKDYVDIDITPQELQDKLFSCGFEVEELYEVGKDISKVVVGLVLECEPIPDTHLHVCQVDCGEHGTFQICCGADNVKAGGKDRRRCYDHREGQTSWRRITRYALFRCRTWCK